VAAVAASAAGSPKPQTLQQMTVKCS